MAGITIIWILYCILVFEDEPFYLCALIFGIILYFLIQYLATRDALTDKEKAQMMKKWEKYKKKKQD